MQETIPRQHLLERAVPPVGESLNQRFERWLGKRISFPNQIFFCVLVLATVAAVGWEIHDEYQITPLFLCLGSSVFLSLFTGWQVALAYSFLSSCMADFLFISQHHHVELDVHFFLRLTVFAGISLLVNFLVGHLRNAYSISTEARQAAEKANREKDELIAILSHDLRAPLTAVQLSLQLIDRQIKGNDLYENIQRHTERALDACRRVNNLVLDLLDSTKASAGGLSLQRDTHDISGLARSVANEMRVLAAQQEITLDASGVGGALPLYCDANRILQLLANLVGNALKFTPRGGVVRVATGRADGYVKLIVSDSGVGMTKEQLSHIFERFWQAERKNRTGVGLGLFIVKAIVDAHGGSIAVESEPGKGTAFTVKVPIAPTSRE